MTKNILKIALNQEGKIGLELLEKKSSNDLVVLDIIHWDDKNQTSQKLLKQIDGFLTKNNLKVTELSEIQTGISAEQKFTLARIIKITAETLNYCLKEKKDSET